MLTGDTKCKTMGKLCGNSQSGRFIGNESSLQRCKKMLRLLADRSVDWHLSDKMIVCQNLHSSTHVSHTIVVLFSFLWTPGLTIYIINHNSHWNHSVFGVFLVWLVSIHSPVYVSTLVFCTEYFCYVPVLQYLFSFVVLMCIVLHWDVLFIKRIIWTKVYFGDCLQGDGVTHSADCWLLHRKCGWYYKI